MKRRSGFKSAGRMQTPHETTIPRDALERRPPHARHELHVEHHIGAVGDFNAATRERRIDGPHAVRDDVQGAPLHAAGKQGVHLGVRLIGRQPRIVRAGIVAALGAYVGYVLDSRDIRRVRAVQIASGKALLIEGEQLLPRHQPAFERQILGIAAVAPVNPLRPGEPRDLIDPGRDITVQRGERRDVRGCGGHKNPRQWVL